MLLTKSLENGIVVRENVVYTREEYEKLQRDKIILI